jgi:hypothetical protein
LEWLKEARRYFVVNLKDTVCTAAVYLQDWKPVWLSATPEHHKLQSRGIFPVLV